VRGPQHDRDGVEGRADQALLGDRFDDLAVVDVVADVATPR